MTQATALIPSLPWLHASPHNVQATTSLSLSTLESMEGALPRRVTAPGEAPVGDRFERRHDAGLEQRTNADGVEHRGDRAVDGVRPPRRRHLRATVRQRARTSAGKIVPRRHCAARSSPFQVFLDSC